MAHEGERVDEWLAPNILPYYDDLPDVIVWVRLLQLMLYGVDWLAPSCQQPVH